MSVYSLSNVPSQIKSAINKASKATGADFDYLLRTAHRESAFKARAKARTSTAAGLFQFIESTWLQTLKQNGHQLGLEGYAKHISQTPSGRYVVPDARMRDRILRMRYDPEIASVVAGAYTQENASTMRNKIGRNPSQGELYIAHFLGADDASRLVQLSIDRPNLRADRVFAQEARANRSVFYAGRKPRTVKQVYENLVAKHARTVHGEGTGNSANQPQRIWPVGFSSAETWFQPRARVRVASLQTIPPMGHAVATQQAAKPRGIGAWRTVVRRENLSSDAVTANRIDQAPSRRMRGWKRVATLSTPSLQEKNAAQTVNSAPKLNTAARIKTTGSSIFHGRYLESWAREAFEPK